MQLCLHEILMEDSQVKPSNMDVEDSWLLIEKGWLAGLPKANQHLYAYSKDESD